MKCIRLNSGEIVRTSNEEAGDAVDAGNATFVAKHTWRAAGAARAGRQTSKGKVSIHPPLGWVNTSNKKPAWAR